VIGDEFLLSYARIGSELTIDTLSGGLKGTASGLEWQNEFG